MNTQVYGIPNCDTVRKARKWLQQHKIAYDFADFRQEQTLSEALLRAWEAQIGAELLINRKSKTWRELSTEEKEIFVAGSLDYALILQKPTLLKRPILVHGEALEVGFAPAVYAKIFDKG